MQEPLYGFEWNQMAAPWEVERGLLTVVASDSGGKYHAVGTGFVVNARSESAIAITAAHVLAEVQRLQQKGGRRSHATTLSEFAPSLKPINVSIAGLAMLARSESKIVVGVVGGLALDEAGDVGVVQLTPQKGQEADFTLREFMLEDETPHTGQLVFLASYVGLTCKTDEVGVFKIERQAILRVGKVLGVYPSGHRLCRGSCFETSIPVFSGMSGGPVCCYDGSGAIRVIGLVCSDPDPDGPTKNDRSVAGRSLVARLPSMRVSGTAKGKQEVMMSIAPTGMSGQFTNSVDVQLTTWFAKKPLP